MLKYIKQSGFSGVFALLVVAVLIGGGAFAFSNLTKQDKIDTDNSEVAVEDGAATASTSTDKSAPKETKTAKSNVKACDLLTESKVSEFMGTKMVYALPPNDELGNMSDGHTMVSLCTFIAADASIAENEGVTVTAVEALSPQAKADMSVAIAGFKIDGSVKMPGYGVDVYKLEDPSDIAAPQYTAVVGNVLLTISAGTGHADPNAPDIVTLGDSFYVDPEDKAIEAMLKYVINQLK